MSNFRPMSEAPRNGDEILICYADGQRIRVHWDSPMWKDAFSINYPSDVALGWLPLGEQK